MDILNRLQGAAARFDELKEKLGQHETAAKQIADEANEKIAQLHNAMGEITDEMKRVQGEYRTWVTIGQEANLLDTNGNPIPKTPEAVPAPEAQEAPALQAVPNHPAQG